MITAVVSVPQKVCVDLELDAGKVEQLFMSPTGARLLAEWMECPLRRRHLIFLLRQGADAIDATQPLKQQFHEAWLKGQPEFHARGQ